MPAPNLPPPGLMCTRHRGGALTGVLQAHKRATAVRGAAAGAAAAAPLTTLKQLLKTSPIYSFLGPTSLQVFYKRTSVPLLSGAQLRALLQQHLTANIMRVGARFLHQSRGIPQGSLASTLLCRCGVFGGIWLEFGCGVFGGIGGRIGCGVRDEGWFSLLGGANVTSVQAEEYP
jgi:hypothetical protein